MRIALVITPFDDHNLQLARQIGVIDIVVRYPGPHRADLEPLVERVDRQQMRVSVVEGYLPLDQVQSGSSGRAHQIDRISRLIESMAALGVGTLCYNWMGAHRCDAHIGCYAGARRRAVHASSIWLRPRGSLRWILRS